VQGIQSPIPYRLKRAHPVLRVFYYPARRSEYNPVSVTLRRVLLLPPSNPWRNGTPVLTSNASFNQMPEVFPLPRTLAGTSGKNVFEIARGIRTIFLTEGPCDRGMKSLTPRTRFCFEVFVKGNVPRTSPRSFTAPARNTRPKKSRGTQYTPKNARALHVWQ